MATEVVAISELASVIPGARAVGEAAVSSVTHDSRTVQAGSLFVAIRGMESDGHDFAHSAVAGGAVAIAVDHQLELEIAQLVVTDTRAALAPLAATVYRHPSDEIDVLGVTGTNGKTTITHMLASIADEAGIDAGVVGTVGASVGGRSWPMTHTTPEASDLQALLRLMVDDGIDLAALEVSSHALDLHRVDDISFSAVAFTNLSQDHLDYHGTMETYYATKAALFTSSRAEVGIVNIDDPAGRRLVGDTDLRVSTVSVRGADADIAAEVVAADLTGSTVLLRTSGWEGEFRLPLSGLFNISNAAIAAAMALEVGIEQGAVTAGLSSIGTIPGRSERIEAGQPFGVVVDYAHTPDAVRNIVVSTQDIADGRVIVVVGAGGDRDQAKRPLMGAATSAADMVVVTSDNPRSEDPDTIVAQVAEGTGREVERRVDRREAIRLAVGFAEPGDAVLILGRGHETGQRIGDETLPFDDREVAREELAALGFGGSA